MPKLFFAKYAQPHCQISCGLPGIYKAEKIPALNHPAESIAFTQYLHIFSIVECYFCMQSAVHSKD